MIQRDEARREEEAALLRAAAAANEAGTAARVPTPTESVASS